MSVRLTLMSTAAAAALLCGCAHDNNPFTVADAQIVAEENAGSVKDGAVTVADLPADNGYPVPVAAPPIDARAAMADAHISAQHVAYGEPQMMPSEVIGPRAVAETDGPYLLDTGDRLRIFVYGQPNLSRQYIVDHDGKISVPLIGEVTARAKTTSELQGIIRSRLGSQFVKDPQVTVDVQQNRPFFIYGEVKTAGQYPYVSGMTIETAIAIAGGYTDRASERKYRLTRRVNGFVEQIEAPGDYVVKPGDTVYVFERFF
ncbi:MAG: polysaccharide biosynthesis/export family protein [Hyphomicrobium sp.]|nr:polysaccharide export protein [Hyphomicrobium sp.]